MRLLGLLQRVRQRVISEPSRRRVRELWSGLVSSTAYLLDRSRLLEGLGYVAQVCVLMIGLSGLLQGLVWVVGDGRSAIAIGVTALATLLTVLVGALISSRRFHHDLHIRGFRWPTALAVAFAWMSVLVFGSWSCILSGHGYTALSSASPAPAEGSCSGFYADLYLWHLLHSIPLIDFTETIGWKQKFSYSDSLTGWLVLAFKVSVIIPVLRAFVIAGTLRADARGKRNVV